MNKTDCETIAAAFNVTRDCVASWYFGSCPMSDYIDEDIFEHVYDDACDEKMGAAHQAFTMLAEANESLPYQGDIGIIYICTGEWGVPHGGRHKNNFSAPATRMIENARKIVTSRKR